MSANGQHPRLDELAAAAAAQPQPQAQQLPFKPVETNFTVLGADLGGNSIVLLIVTTPVGQAGYFLTPEIAKQVAGFLTNTAAAAASGLTVIGDVGSDETPA